jgi:hypothetical protein
MREIEEALAARLCQAGTSKDAILTAFRAAICNGTSLTDELAASGAAAEAAIARTPGSSVCRDTGGCDNCCEFGGRATRTPTLASVDGCDQ